MPELEPANPPARSCAVIEGTRTIIIDQTAEAGRETQLATLLARLLRNWRPALAISMTALVAVSAWDFFRSNRIQTVSYVIARPTFETPTLPAAADVAKAINDLPSTEWNVPHRRGKFEARTDKNIAGVEVTFTPATSDQDTERFCRAEAEHIVAQLNEILEPDFNRARLSLDATITALEASISEAMALARDSSSANGSADAVLLHRQASDMRERQATQRALRESLRAARIIGSGNTRRAAPVALPPLLGLAAGGIAFAASLVFISFTADVVAAVRAANAGDT